MDRLGKIVSRSTNQPTNQDTDGLFCPLRIPQTEAGGACFMYDDDSGHTGSTHSAMPARKSQIWVDDQRSTRASYTFLYDYSGQSVSTMERFKGADHMNHLVTTLLTCAHVLSSGRAERYGWQRQSDHYGRKSKLLSTFGAFRLSRRNAMAKAALDMSDRP
jgi:hypothetical protein